MTGHEVEINRRRLSPLVWIYVADCTTCEASSSSYYRLGADKWAQLHKQRTAQGGVA